MTFRSFVLFVITLIATDSVADEHGAERAILVTDASSVLGRAIVQRLTDENFYVYAGTRNVQDVATLNAKYNVSAIKLDVTNQDEIDAAVDYVSGQGRGLWGVVNNAELAIFAKMRNVAEDDINRVFDVNTLGPFRINKAFESMLIDSGGRTTTVSSTAGFVVGATGGLDSMSRFAVEAYTDAYSAEMGVAGVHVSIIEPGGFMSSDRHRHAPTVSGSPVADLTDQQREQLRDRGDDETGKVAAAVLHSMSAEKPKRRYLLTSEMYAVMPIWALIRRLAEINHDQPYEFSRDELVQMLDRVLAAYEKMPD